jgi:DNA-directed RNA polymerase specialized sigma24 family protein
MVAVGPENTVSDKELRILSWRAVWNMPEHLRRVITHLYICDRSPEDTAMLLGVDSNTLESLHKKAIENLRGRIKWQ